MASGLPQLKVKSKIWLEADGEVVFGLGRARLFMAIDQTGSINQAAAVLGMSYRAAWGKITATEKRLKIPLVERHPGSRERGTNLTPEGREMLRQFQLFHQDALLHVDDTFDKHFTGLLIRLEQDRIAGEK
ncbi:MAG: LysR family transcriptional regulator [Heliobacteriaceae bacterium]|nr:LysR family transcriptional regulator [Heliobacteriaceae bacterium]MDD4587090.1 LysR family transcriptional regulator [Heliobacteriaceae bacterium]